LLTPLVTLGGYREYYGRPAAVAFDGDTVILMGGYTGHLGLTRVASDGQVVTPVWMLIKGAASTIGSYDLVRIGGDVVAAGSRRTVPASSGSQRSSRDARRRAERPSVRNHWGGGVRLCRPGDATPV
jgi:hypothetical protein